MIYLSTTRSLQYLEQKGWLISKIDVSIDLGECRSAFIVAIHYDTMMRRWQPSRLEKADRGS